MYLDPGSTSLVIQALFAALAAFFTMFGRARLWFTGFVARVVRVVLRNRCRRDA